VKRFGQRLGLKRGKTSEYIRYHQNIWPEIATAIHAAGIRNYSIFHFKGQLFGYYEYHGADGEYEACMKKLASAPRMQEWWDIMESMQIPDADRAEGTWWSEMDEVFHQD